MTDVVSSHYPWSRNTMAGNPKQQHQYSKSIHLTVPRFTKDIPSRTPLCKITLYRNGDRYFPGKQISIIPQNYTDLQFFLQQLSSIIDLPYGVRHLFTPHNGSEITNIHFLKDGASYVCASFEPFQKLEYKAINIPRIISRSEHLRQPLNDIHSPGRVNVRHLPTTSLPKVGAINGSVTTTTNRFLANNLFLQSFTSAAANSIQQQQQKKQNLKQNKYGLEPLANKPRSITIVKQGHEKTHKTITILLNRRTVQTFEQLLSDISEAFGYQKNRSDKIKCLYNLKGRQVNGINDFFRDDDVFVAVTNSTDISSVDLNEISLRIFNDPQQSIHHRKKNVRKSVDQDTVTTGPKEEDGLSRKNSGLTSTRKPHENSFENTTTPNHSHRKGKKVHKLPTINSIEQQRERERQRLRDEEEQRRKKIFLKKEFQPAVQIFSVPKFEQLIIDINTNEPSHPTKIKTPTSVKTKVSSIPSLPTNHSNENEIISLSKTSTIKKRSLIVHPSPSIVTDKYDLGKKMGDGNFAIVRRSKLRNTDREYAVKIIDKSKMKGKHYMLEHEINIMYICNHPNIIRLFEDYETADEIYLVMELVKGGDLFEYITKHRCFNESTSALMIKDVSEALLYLHAKNIVHRDVKPENLLVMQKRDGRVTIKLTDFGLALQLTGSVKTVCGTPTYVAPEILAETGYGIEVDCWATGIILYILLCGYPPFKTAERNQEELFQMIQRGKFSYDTEYWNTISSSAKSLIDQLLIVDRQKRMRADEILLHPWILTVGQSKPIRNTEELKTTLRLQYDLKMKEYATETIAN
ncbi:unnamed protein product [Adineta steineri]|uniref:non-specific serine/threonine protein kinase n=1 Tax=Adineta steineri TaxID=433720 RepID=A0A813RA54_9BILA|nr:unnamed protein product [Adineta steineri]